MYMQFEEAGLISGKDVMKDHIWKDIHYVMKGGTNHEKEDSISNVSDCHVADRDVLCVAG